MPAVDGADAELGLNVAVAELRGQPTAEVVAQRLGPGICGLVRLLGLEIHERELAGEHLGRCAVLQGDRGSHANMARTPCSVVPSLPTSLMSSPSEPSSLVLAVR